MSKSVIGDQLWAEMTEAQKIESVSQGHATITQLTEGLLDGSDELRRVSREALAHADLSANNFSAETPTEKSSKKRKQKTRAAPPSSCKQRFGLPAGFVPRLQRYGRTVLLEQNVYRLPNGIELVPTRPVGTLAASRHVYALLTIEQHSSGQRGSIYVRTDGRIFDYSADTAAPVGDFFDTGYTIYDLERTGKYATEPEPRSKRRSAVAVKRAHAG